MRTIFLSSTVLLTIVWALGFGLLSAYAVVLAFFRILMPKPTAPKTAAHTTATSQVADHPIVGR